MKYRIDISRPALTDAEKTYLWLKEESEEIANKWFKDLVKTINSLQNFPSRCPLAPETRSFLIDIRQLLYGKGKQQYRILFGISVDEKTAEDVVLIYRIRHSSQKYLDGIEILGRKNDE